MPTGLNRHNEQLIIVPILSSTSCSGDETLFTKRGFEGAEVQLLKYGSV
jgi:hypothetical protein